MKLLKRFIKKISKSKNLPLFNLENIVNKFPKTNVYQKKYS